MLKTNIQYSLFNILTFTHRLTAKAIFYHPQTWWLLAAFLLFRLLSYIAHPFPLVQAAVVFVLLLAFGLLYFKRTDYAWWVLLGEIFLGGSGHLFEFFDLSLRTVLVLAFFFLWLMEHVSAAELRHRLWIRHPAFVWLFPLVFFVTLAVFLGLIRGHGAEAVIGDALPYSYLLLVLPLYHHFQNEHTQAYLVRLLIAFIFGSAIVSVVTFILFSSGIEVVNGTEYYSWFRDVVMGKVTDMGNGFFRVVLPEHLLLVPGILFLASLLMRTEPHHAMWRVLLGIASFILVLDLSRTYFLALAVGLLILKYKHNIWKWLRVSVGTGVCIIVLAASIAFAASGGKTFGAELFGVRAWSIVAPTTEESAYTRSMLLEPAIEAIGAHPFFGNGFGATISFISPITFQYITTAQFDWGYLELLTELGIFGALALLIVVCFAVYELLGKIESLSEYQDFYVGLFAGIVSLLVMTVTSPALFHVFGIVYLALVLSVSLKPISIFDHILTILYRVFRHNHVIK